MAAAAAAAATSTSFSPSVAATSSSKSLKPEGKTLAVNVGFMSSTSAKTALYSLKARALTSNGGGSVSGSAIGARMVSVPAVKPPTLLDFDTSVFKKEKISLAGYDEVFPFSLYLSIYISLYICKGFAEMIRSFVDCSIL